MEGTTKGTTHSNGKTQRLKDDEINWELTSKLRKEPKFIAFNKWAIENGAILPNVEYPTAFGEEGLVGASTKTDISPKTAYLFVPNKLLISNLSIRRSEIAHVFLDNPALFEEHPDGEYLSLIVFMIYELLKGTVGEKSFWKPYFDILPEADFLPLWSKAELAELQDPELIQEALEYKEELEEEWMDVQVVLKKYPDIFPKEKVDRKLFTFAYANVVTRCFGWSLPCTMLIPVADGLNHAPIDVSNEMIDTELHKKAVIKELGEDEKVKLYATKSKMKFNYPHIIDVEGKENIAVKPFVVDDDVVTICKDMSTLKLKEKDYDIWNVYFFKV